MSKRTKQQRNDLMELVSGRPGWRLEPRTTPGASPVWCFVVNGQVELSASADNDGLHLYVMATDQEFVMPTTEDLTAWLKSHRPVALSERQVSPSGKARMKGLFEWS